MRQFSVFLVCALILVARANTVRAAEASFVKIEIPLANIYEFLDPKSNILKVAKKGDYFELVYEGTSFFQVKVKDKVGWLEKKNGLVVSNPNPTYLGTFIIITVLFVGTLAGVSYFIYRQRSAEA